jgi:hypothetical protein
LKDGSIGRVVKSVKVELTKGAEAIIDIDDLEKVIEGNWWHLSKAGYAAKHEMVDGKSTMIYMHRLVIGAKKGEVVDHVNGDKLDNRRNNLRIVTQHQNCYNSKPKGSTSKYKGVYFCNKRKRYYARIKKHGKQRSLGGYSNEIDAAKAYNTAAVDVFGDYANLNEIDESEAIN